MTRLGAAACAAIIAGSGCGRSTVSIDRSFLGRFPENPTEADLSGRYDALRYLVATGDRDAVRAVLRYVTSDARVNELAAAGCPCHNDEDLVSAAYDESLDGLFWTTLPALPPVRQARAIVHVDFLSQREDSGGMSLHPMVDYEGDRDAYLAAHPEVARELAGVLRALTAQHRAVQPAAD